MTDDDSMDYVAAAAFLGVSRRTLERMVREGDVPSISVRGRRTFSRAGLTKWKQQREAESVARRRKSRNAVMSTVTG